MIVVVLGLATAGTHAQESVGTPAEDIDIVFDEGVDFANAILGEKTVEPFPFIVVMATDGQVKTVIVDPPRNRALKKVLESLRWEAASSGRIRAVAVFSVEKFVDPSDNKKRNMIRVSREHVSGNCTEFLFPYAPPVEKIEFDRLLLIPDSNGRVLSNCN